MNVLVIPSWYPSGIDKLMGIYHKEFTESLNNYGVKANMLFIERERLSNPLNYLLKNKKRIDKESNYNVYIYKMLNYEPISFDLQMNLYVKKLEKAFKNYLKYNEMPDIIHAEVTLPAGYAACILGKKYNIPVIVTEHYSKFETFFKNNNYKKYTDFVIKNSVYSTVSKYMKDIVLKYSDNCIIIPNLIDTKKFKISKNKKNPFKLIIISALRNGKRIDVALDAIRILNEKKFDIHLDIVGDGYNINSYKKLAENLENVTFLGKLIKKDLINKLNEENALLICSEYETFCIPGVEAMASGLPIITTDCLGPTEYVNDKVGLICKTNDPKDMAQKILELYNNYDKYDPNVIKNEALKYDSETVIKNTIKIYEQIKKVLCQIVLVDNKFDK